MHSTTRVQTQLHTSRTDLQPRLFARTQTLTLQSVKYTQINAGVAEMKFRLWPHLASPRPFATTSNYIHMDLDSGSLVWAYYVSQTMTLPWVGMLLGLHYPAFLTTASILEAMVQRRLPWPATWAPAHWQHQCQSLLHTLESLMTVRKRKWRDVRRANWNPTVSYSIPIWLWKALYLKYCLNVVGTQ